MSHQNIFSYSAMFISTALASISVMASREKARHAGMSNTYKMERTPVYVGALVALTLFRFLNHEAARVLGGGQARLIVGDCAAGQEGAGWP
jgi:hypothetical protein